MNGRRVSEGGNPFSVLRSTIGEMQKMLSQEKKILVVDDEATQRLLLSKILQSVPHYQVIEANDGSNALERLKKEYIDLILLDINMPVMNGFETLAAIREDEKLSDIPVIMCTAVSEREEVVRILQQGVAGYIVKPINKEDILPKVEEVLAAFDDASNQEETEQTTDNYLVLIADEDENFRKVAKVVMNPYYNIIEAENESLSEQLIFDKRPQIILLGKLAGTLNYGSFFSRLNPLIQGKKIRMYRVYSTVIEAMAERELKYHGRLLRTLDINILRSRLHELMVLPNFTVYRQKSAVVVRLENYYPRNEQENRILLRSIARALGSDMRTIRFNLSDWAPESTTDALETASCYLEKVVAEFKLLGIKVGVMGYELPEGSPLAALFADHIAELQQEYVHYLTRRITRLQQYYKLQDAKLIISLAKDLNDYGKEHGFSQLSLIAGMLIRESNGKNWKAVQALIGQLLREEKKIEENSI